jgi:Cu+-exporting ATPase
MSIAAMAVRDAESETLVANRHNAQSVYGRARWTNDNSIIQHCFYILPHVSQTAYSFTGNPALTWLRQKRDNSIKRSVLMSTTFKDPVCGMDVTPESAAGKSEYNGQTYYFCSLGCKKAFEKEPEKYLKVGVHIHQH